MNSCGQLKHENESTEICYLISVFYHISGHKVGRKDYIGIIDGYISVRNINKDRLSC